MASIITAPWAKLTMRRTPNTSVRPLATRPYTPPRRRPLTTAWRRSPPVTSAGRPPAPSRLPLGHREDGLGLRVLRGAHDRRPAVLHLDQGGRGVDVLAGVVEVDGALGQDVVGEVRPGERVADLLAVCRCRPLEGVLQHEGHLISLHPVVRH